MGARALTLYERLGRTDLAFEAADPDLHTQRLARWRDSCAKGDDTEFRRRLSDDGIDPARLDALLGEARFRPGAPLPQWTGFVRDALAAAAGWSVAEIFTPYPEPGHHPFYALVRPFAEHAFSLLRQRLPGRKTAPAWPALAGACNYLVYLLATHAALTFNLEFTIFKSLRESALESALRQARDERSDRLYREFVLEFYETRWSAFLQEYAVLARQIATTAAEWVDAIDEMLERFENDRPELEQAFNSGRPFGALRQVEYGVSDRHNGGRCTAILHFAHDVRLVYKPKPLDTDLLLADLIEWINGTGELLALANVTTMKRAGYGWQAFIAPAPCADEAAVARFYVRAGYLLALTYALEGYDFHHENLIAGGEQPYLVDTETIFNPYKEMDVNTAREPNAALLASKTVYYSVIRTGMLPTWSIRADGRKQDSTGFGGASVEGNAAQPLSGWTNLDSDDLRLESKLVPMQQRPNQPFITPGRPEVADAHVEDILSGFRAMYDLLARRRAEFASLIHRRKDIHVRFVRKPTQLYAQQMWTLTNPEFMRSGVDWSIEVDFMARMFLAADADAVPWGLLRAEHAALIQLDLPYFKVRADGVDITDAQGRALAPGYFSHGCLDRLEHKLDKLDAADRALQERYIAYAFYARAAKSYHDEMDALAARGDYAKESTDHLPPVDAATCRQIAEEVAQELGEEALRASDGSAAWIALEYLKESDAFQFKPISYNLYSGGCGPAYFLAALARVTGNAAYGQLAAAAVRPMLKVVDRELDSLLRFTGVGGGVGVGSLIYALASIADFLGDDPFAETAREYACRCAARIDAQTLKADERFDLIFGTAGLLLGLVKLHRTTGDGTTLDRIRLAADYLLASRTEIDAGLALVPTLNGKAVTGVSHGAAGVALALMRAYEVTGTAAYRDAAMAHVAFEERLYDSVEANYPDYRSRVDRPAFLTSWCHGAPGIGLSRLALHRITGDQSLVPQIEKNMRKTAAFTLDHIDHICCGNFGRLDIQLEYARHTGDAALLEGLRRDASYAVERYRRDGGFRLFINAPNKVFSPGLFVGATGTAYSLLRLSAPDALPCVLAYD